VQGIGDLAGQKLVSKGAKGANERGLGIGTLAGQKLISRSKAAKIAKPTPDTLWQPWQPWHSWDLSGYASKLPATSLQREEKHHETRR
jgi:hypothetical protein